MSEINYIAIEGVIGAGKTSLAKMLAERLNSKLILEEFEKNPFLENFYNEPERYAFQTQMFFLINRFKQLQELKQENLFSRFIVSDYIFDKDRIFAYLNLTKDELTLYESIFPLLRRDIRKPDLVVFLQSGTERLVYNIKKRGRRFERGITRNYIRDLSEAYNNYLFMYKDAPLLIVNSTEIDFVNNKNDFEELFREIFRKDRAHIEYFNPERRSR